MSNKKNLNSIIKDKKGGEKWLSVWWFFVLAIIGGGIVVGVLIYYSADVNIKEFEADVLAERIARCLIENGHLKQEFLQENFDVFETCNLKKEIFGEGSNFYFKISARGADENLLRKDIEGGRAAFEKECGIESSTKASKFPKCAYKKEAVIYLVKNAEVPEEEKEMPGKLQIIAGSNQKIKSVQNV
jgi:hypothetical protein